jgi:hypothetical protein
MTATEGTQKSQKMGIVDCVWRPDLHRKEGILAVCVITACTALLLSLIPNSVTLYSQNNATGRGPSSLASARLVKFNGGLRRSSLFPNPVPQPRAATNDDVPFSNPGAAVRTRKLSKPDWAGMQINEIMKY